MREGLLIKMNWLVLKRPILKNLALLGIKDAKSFYKIVRKTYKEDLKSVSEFSKMIF